MLEELCWSPGDRGQVQPGWCTANRKPAGVRPITQPLRSEQKHKETKMFGAITATQRGTCLVLIVSTHLVSFRGFWCFINSVYLRKYYFLANYMQSGWKTWSHSVINIIIIHFMQNNYLLHARVQTHTHTWNYYCTSSSEFLWRATANSCLMNKLSPLNMAQSHVSLKTI